MIASPGSFYYFLFLCGADPWLVRFRQNLAADRSPSINMHNVVGETSARWYRHIRRKKFRKDSGFNVVRSRRKLQKMKSI